MRSRGWEDFFAVDSDGNIRTRAANYEFSAAFTASLPSRQNLTIEDGPSQLQVVANLDGTEEGGDVYELSLVAGQTYSWAYRPSANGGIEDPLLALFDSQFGQLAVDDDGGAGRSSLITFTPTTTGTYYLYATSWVNQGGGNDVGGYTIDQWSPTSSPDAPAATANAAEIQPGATTFGHLTSATDVDVFKVNLTGGNYYSFNFSGGVAVNGERTEPGSVRATLELLDAGGNVIATNSANESFAVAAGASGEDVGDH